MAPLRRCARGYRASLFARLLALTCAPLDPHTRAGAGLSRSPGPPFARHPHARAHPHTHRMPGTHTHTYTHAYHCLYHHIFQPPSSPSYLFYSAPPLTLTTIQRHPLKSPPRQIHALIHPLGRTLAPTRARACKDRVGTSSLQLKADAVGKDRVCRGSRSRSTLGCQQNSKRTLSAPAQAPSRFPCPCLMVRRCRQQPRQLSESLSESLPVPVSYCPTLSAGTASPAAAAAAAGGGSCLPRYSEFLKCIALYTKRVRFTPSGPLYTCSFFLCLYLLVFSRRCSTRRTR